jgi:hypothetical protein
MLGPDGRTPRSLAGGAFSRMSEATEQITTETPGAGHRQPRALPGGPHEAVLGLSDPIRTVNIKAPTGCTVDAGDTWRVYNGYFSAAGTFNTQEAAAGKDTDRISVAVPTCNAVAGDEIPVRLKVNDSSAGISGVWDVDDSNAGSLVLLRRTLFKYKGVTDWMNFINEPYICGEAVIRAERDGAAAEHDVRQHSAADASGNLRRQIGSCSTPAQPTESAVDERHHRVEMRTAHRPEHQDRGEQSERRCAGVLGQLKTSIVWRQLLSSNT